MEFDALFYNIFQGFGQQDKNWKPFLELRLEGILELEGIVVFPDSKFSLERAETIINTHCLKFILKI